MRKILKDIKIRAVLLSVAALTLVMATPHFAQGADQDSKSEQNLRKMGSSGQDKDTPDINQGSMLYFLVFNLPDAWQL